jgi:hypothetical protein
VSGMGAVIAAAAALSSVGLLLAILALVATRT